MSLVAFAQQDYRQAVRLVILGCFFEFYDVMLFTHLLLVFGPLFLPPDKPEVATILKIALFTSAYITRPLGALLWGWMGDKFGRISTVMNTILCTSLVTILIPCTPTYQDAGLLGALMFLILRLLQGIAAGAYSQVAAVYIAESIPQPRVYWLDGILSLFCETGTCIAALVAGFFLYLCPTQIGWNLVGWRLALASGSLVAFFGFFARKSLLESPDFLEAQSPRRNFYKKETHKGTSLWKVRAALGLGYMMSSVTFVFLYSYCPWYFLKMGLTPARVLIHSGILALLSGFFQLFYGYFAARFKEPILIYRIKVTLGVYITMLIFITGFIPSGLLSLTAFQIFILATLDTGSSPLRAIFVKAFPVLTRCKNMMLTWSLVKAIMYTFTSSYVEFLTKAGFGMKAMIGFLFGASVLYFTSSMIAGQALKEHVDRPTRFP